MSSPRPTVPIEGLDISVFRIPTDLPEADGTFAWDSTTMVLVEAHAGGMTGIGYTYADEGTGRVIRDTLADVVCGCDAMDVPASWAAMVHIIRNLGRPGVCSMAISAVDVALWDLKARLLDTSLVNLLGAAHESVPVYGSGGFTSYSIEQLQAQLGGWAQSGIPRVKMKIGTHRERPLARAGGARRHRAGCGTVCRREWSIQQKASAGSGGVVSSVRCGLV